MTQTIIPTGADIPEIGSIGVPTLLVRRHAETPRFDGDTIGHVRTLSGQEIDFAPVRVPTPSGPAMTTPIEIQMDRRRRAR